MKQKSILQNAVMLCLVSFVCGSCGQDKLPDPLPMEYADIKIKALWPQDAAQLPSTYIVRVNGVEQDATGNEMTLNVPASSNYNICLYNPAEGISINGNSAVLNSTTSTRAGNDAYTATPGDFFSGGVTLAALSNPEEAVNIEIAKRTHQVKMTLSIENGSVVAASSLINNIAFQIDLITGEAQSYSQVTASFQVTAQGDGKQQISAQMQLFGINPEQPQTMELHLQNEDGTTSIVKSDITESLSNIENVTDQPLEITGKIDIQSMEGTIINWGTEDGGDLPIHKN